MRIRSTKLRHVADARSLGGGEKHYPKTAAGKRAAKLYLNKVQAEFDQKGVFTNAAMTPLLGTAEKDERGDYLDPQCAVVAYITHEDGRARRGELSQAHVDNKLNALNTIANLKYAGKRLSQMRLGDFRAGVIKNDVIPQLFDTGAYMTAQKKFSIFKHFMQWAVESEILMANPALVRLPKKPQVQDRAVDRISKAAINSIIANAAPRYRLLIKTAAWTGMRAGEQLALTWNDIDFDEKVIRINKAIKKGGIIGLPKTRQSLRTIDIEASLLADLREWKLAQPIEQRRFPYLVFPSATGGYDNTSNLRNRGLHPACEAAGVERIRWHDLRHFFASVLLFDVQLGDQIVANLMGHHSISFTASQYGHWMPEARRKSDIGNKLKIALGGNE